MGGFLFVFLFVLFCWMFDAGYVPGQTVYPKSLVFNLLDIVMCRLTHQDPTSGCGEISFVALMFVSLNLI